MKQSVINERYTIQSDKKNLVTSILKNDYERMVQQKDVFNENFLNHWIDALDAGNQVDLETRLENDEWTVSDFKSSISKMDLVSFKDQMIPVMRACLKFAYYQELGKQWSTPMNPLNLIYSEDQNGIGHIKAFYREGSIKDEIDGSFLDEVVKLVTYLFVPEQEDSINQYPDMTGQDYLDKISSDPDFIDMYGQDGEDLIDFIFDCLSPHNNDAFYSVRDILENVGALNEISDVEDPDNKGAFEDGRSNAPSNLNNYQDQSDQDDYYDQSDEDVYDEDEAQERPRKVKSKKKGPEKKRPKQGSKNRKSEQDDQNGKPKKKSKLPVILISALVLGGVGYGAYSFMKPKEEPKQVVPVASSSSSKDPLDNHYFAEGIQKAGAQDYKSAASDFDKFFNSGHTQSELSNQQISTVFSTYLRDEDYQSILDNIGNEKTATALINYLQAKNDEGSIRKLDSSQPIVQFAQADLSNDQSKMISLADRVDLSKNEKYQDDLCKAFADQDKLEEGKQWAESQPDPDKLKASIKGHAYEANKKSHEDIDKILG